MVSSDRSTELTVGQYVVSWSSIEEGDEGSYRAKGETVVWYYVTCQNNYAAHAWQHIKHGGGGQRTRLLL